MTSSTDSRPAVRPWYAHTLSSFPGLAALFVVIALAVIAVVAPALWGEQAATVHPSESRLGPSLDHIFGTDALGRDVLLRVLVGTRATLLYSLGAVVISTALGVGLGLLAVSLGNRARQVMYQVSATATAFPSILLAVLLATLFGRSGLAAMAGLAIAGAPQMARLTMNLATSAASSDAVTAARTVGVRGPRLVLRYILPNVAEPIATLTIMTAASYLMALSALSFVGLGVQAPEWDWGSMLSDALANIYTAPSAIIGPGLAVVVTGIALNVLGESLAAGIDPRNRLYLSPRKSATVRPAGVSSVQPAAPTSNKPEAIAIENLTINANGPAGSIPLIHGVSLHIRAGERVAIVGESGSGKSLTLAALARLLPGGLTATHESHRLFGQDIGGSGLRTTDELLKDRLSMVFQDPMSTLNPALTIGAIMADKMPRAATRNKKQMRKDLAAALTAVGIHDAEQKLNRHPHELSGGQRQRVMLAIALLGETKVLLADEPTTALDVSVQAQMAELLLEFSHKKDASFVIVSHDLALVSSLCERIVVMYKGRIVEDGPTQRVLTAPQHPYTRLLLAAIPAQANTKTNLVPSIVATSNGRNS